MLLLDESCILCWRGIPAALLTTLVGWQPEQSGRAWKCLADEQSAHLHSKAFVDFKSAPVGCVLQYSAFWLRFAGIVSRSTRTLRRGLLRVFSISSGHCLSDFEA